MWILISIIRNGSFPQIPYTCENWCLHKLQIIADILPQPSWYWILRSPVSYPEDEDGWFSTTLSMILPNCTVTHPIKLQSWDTAGWLQTVKSIMCYCSSEWLVTVVDISVRIMTRVTPTIVAVHISRTKLVQRLGGEAVGFVLVATAIIVAVAWRVWYEQMACWLVQRWTYILRFCEAMGSGSAKWPLCAGKHVF